MKGGWFIAFVALAGCASNAPSSGGTSTAADPTFRSLTDAQAYYDKLEQQQRKMLANFPSIKRAPCPPEPGQIPGTP
jgi:hypothetical protein